jgi:glutaredoxin 3
MEIIVYKTNGCGHCIKIGQLMERAGVTHTSYMMGKDFTLKEFKEKFPDVGGFPFVIIDGQPIGGLVETVKLFVERGLVTSRQNQE